MRSDRPKYIHHACRVCRQDQDFKFLQERNQYVQMLMVCTRCGSKIARPGERKVLVGEQLADDYKGPR